ncbi:MAG TPA: hypothetical protein VGR57_02535 [Ktedonobacterales bacterium]|nr:hypothetical protein [Ktedonobacterales bacterium]
MQLIGMRARGVMALLAGALLLVGLPLYQGLVLAPRGYLPVAASEAHQHFGPYLLWYGSHLGADLAFRLMELGIFLLAACLPGPLRRVLWPNEPRGGWTAMLLGILGNLLFAAVLALGMVALPTYAHAYVTQVAQRQSIEQGYAVLVTVETLLAKGLATALFALALAIMSVRGLASGRMPAWFAYLGLATASLLGTSAVFSVGGLLFNAPATDTFALSFYALWLVMLGVLFLRIQRQPATEAESAPAATPR